MAETLIPITPHGILLDQVLENKITNLLTVNPKTEKIRWRFSAIKSAGAPPKFSVTQGAFEDNDAKKSETLSVYGYSHVIEKMAPSITTTNSPESKTFKPLQIIFENNHNAGQLIDLFAQGIGMKQINILEIVKEDKSKVHRKKFEDCQPIGFQFYGSFMVMYYTYLKITDTKRVFDKHGDDKGTKGYIASITEPPKN